MKIPKLTWLITVLVTILGIIGFFCVPLPISQDSIANYQTKIYIIQAYLSIISVLLSGIAIYRAYQVGQKQITISKKQLTLSEASDKNTQMVTALIHTISIHENNTSRYILDILKHLKEEKQA